jgi:hypothetical protein
MGLIEITGHVNGVEDRNALFQEGGSESSAFDLLNGSVDSTPSPARNDTGPHATTIPGMPLYHCIHHRIMHQQTLPYQSLDKVSAFSKSGNCQAEPCSQKDCLPSPAD